MFLTRKGYLSGGFGTEGICPGDLCPDNEKVYTESSSHTELETSSLMLLYMACLPLSAYF